MTCTGISAVSKFCVRLLLAPTPRVSMHKPPEVINFVSPTFRAMVWFIDTFTPASPWKKNHQPNGPNGPNGS